MSGYDVAQVKQAIKNKWDWRSGDFHYTPILVWGGPGIGKTHILNQVVSERKIVELKENSDPRLERLLEFNRPEDVEDILEENLLNIRLAERPLEQIEGMPYPYPKEGYMEFLAPKNLQKLKAAKWVVILLDELDKAGPAKMAAVTHLIESGVVGDFKFPKDTFVVAAANRVTDSYLSRPISAELCNRMAHIELVPTVDNFVSWAKNCEDILDEVIAFHRFNKLRNENYLLSDDKDREVETVRAFKSPRSWHYGSRQMKKIYTRHGCKPGQIINVDDEAFFELEQLVGERPAIEFATYLRLYRDIDVGRILKGELVLPTGDRKDCLSNQYTFTMVLIDQLTERDLKKHGLKYVVRAMCEMYPEVCSVFLSALSSSNKKVFEHIVNSKEANDSGMIKQVLDGLM